MAKKAKVLRKVDKYLGYLYVCSNCKHFVCTNKCRHCSAEMEWGTIEDYSGKVEWEQEEDE